MNSIKGIDEGATFAGCAIKDKIQDPFKVNLDQPSVRTRYADGGGDGTPAHRG